ncbi:MULTISPECIES: hypothetical protein [Staphylococcus]|uniref:hypothetical protein n=1 Tax=Staphylococcus TaxID=1279 RepID=UPI001919BF22|nr:MULTISPECIES: hypothetical protein [Staphylococcus]QQS86558.1 hypothetical protein I6J04_13225 [Staphylococcus carnosus]
MTKTMQKLEQLEYFDTGTIITVESKDGCIYTDAELIDIDEVTVGDGLTKSLHYFMYIRLEDKTTVTIREDFIKSVTLEF